MSEPHVRFDEEEDAVAALELVAAVSPDLKASPSLWKWMVMGMQNAMQAAMVLALQGTDGCGALREKSQTRNREWLDNPQGPQPKVIMADYGELLFRVQDEALMENKPLVVSSEEWRTLDRLNKLRRDFAHFNPKKWSIELKLLTNIMPLALKTIEFLLDQERVKRQFSEGQLKRIAASLAGARAAIADLEKKETTTKIAGG